ncbi:alanine/glycine:cation symporter family protein [Vannielia litorea]|uniref:alanine/glycine:cation symporter family protein n=1 Tax=Vannielia litorea TaxID=1217970 RepID=UPI001C97D4E0|nr:alanine/glycine:cation symporter family protein [Vannielia litorea]MBY6047630.1 alanine:cation symporter family protein [Vannielia litorea]MBY6075044.1 alanine:cation symporter family protein [Vannielia litorea]
MGFLDSIFNVINDLTWGWALVPFLVVLGCFFTISSGFVQFRFFTRMFKVLTGTDEDNDPTKISAREALFVSVGGRVGGGNIAGVAVAITAGGPGAVFWMWAIALVGMCSALVEATLAQVFKRTEENGDYRGGPARAIIHGLGMNYRWLAVIYAVCLIASFSIGFNAFQGNTVAGAALDSMNIPRLATGAVLAVLTAVIVWGGIHRIAKAADIIIPVMAFMYIGMALVIIVINIGSLPGVITDIVANAFGFREAVAGGMGAAIANGLRRGLFSNEAGLGSAPNVAATAYVKHPVSQGITQSFSVFIDTIIICSCTAFVILLGDVYQPGAEGIDGVALTQQSMVGHVGGWVQYYLTVAILLFSFSSIMYNYYLGENALTFMTDSKMAIQVLRVAIVCIVFLGAVAPGATFVFNFSDPMMGILAVVNLLALAMLFPVAVRLINDFRGQLKAGVKMPVFDPAKFPDIDSDPTAWPDAPKAPAE